jgi:hypothetical protein
MTGRALVVRGHSDLLKWSMKQCPKCGQTKPFSDFYRDRNSKTGYRSHCKSCIAAAYQAAKLARRRYWASDRGREVKRRFRQNHLSELRAEDEARRLAALARLDTIKLERGCVDCGYREHPAALDFDHRDPAHKTAEVSQIARHGWAKVVAEIAKCDVRCANCHRVRTFQNKHGSRRPAQPDQGKLL